MKNRKSAILSRLSQDSLLSLIPGFIELSLEYGLIRRLKPRELVCAQGERLENLIIPIFGSLRMHRIQVHQEHEVGLLQESRSLGLKQILFNEPTPFAATSEGPTQVLSIPVDRFMNHLARHPEIHNYLRLMASSSGVRAFRELLVDRRIKFESICRVFSCIDSLPVRLKVGQDLDMTKPSLWLVSSGSLTMGGKSKSKSGVSRNVLGEASFFGAEALSAPYSYSYRLVATEATVLYRADLLRLRPVLIELGLIDSLIVSSRAKIQVRNLSSFSKWDGVILPGRNLSRLELDSLSTPIDEKSIRYGTAPSNSRFDSVHNFVLFLEHPVQMNSLDLDLRLQGISYATLAQALERFGYVCRAAKCSLKQLSRQPLPALVGYGPRWSVLLKKEKGQCWLIDSIQGFLSVSENDFAAHWNGEIFYAESAIADWIPNTPNKPFEIVLAVFSTAIPHMASLFGVRVLALAISAVLPLLAGYLMDRLVGGAPFSELVWIALAGVLLFTGVSFLGMVAGLIGIELDQRFDFRLRIMFFRMMTRLRSTAKITLGQLCTYEREFAGIADFWLRVFTHLSFDVAAIVLFSLMLAAVDLRFPLVGMGLLVILTVMRSSVAGRRRTLYEKQLEASANIRQMTSEIIGSINTVKAAGAETMSRHALEGAQLAGWRLRLKSGVFQIATEGSLHLLSTLALAFTLYIATQLSLRGEIGLGEVMTINVLMMGLIGHLHVIAAQIGRLEEVRASSRKLSEFFQLPADSAAESVISDLNASLTGHIEFDHVTFSYPGSPRPIFNDLSFSIYPNQTVAIVGKSGTGKSTLAKLIAGEAQPNSGRIFLDGYDVGFLSPECRRREIGVVMQKSDLFSGSVLENVAFGADNASVERVRSSLSLAAAKGFVEDLHRGMNHHLAEGGLGLSGGEKQRIAIARSIYSRPNIYVFDEATSALDSGSESVVVDNMRKFLAGRTAVIIAHRLSTVRAADRILVLSEGRLVEDGTHDELIAKNGHYAELFGDQFAVAQGGA